MWIANMGPTAAVAAPLPSDHCVPVIIENSKDVVVGNNYTQCVTEIVIRHSKHVMIEGNYYRPKERGDADVR